MDAPSSGEAITPTPEDIAKQKEEEKNQKVKDFFDEFKILSAKYGLDIGAKLIYEDTGIKVLPVIVELPSKSAGTNESK